MTKIVEYRGYGSQFLVVLEGGVPLWFYARTPVEISDELFEDFQKKGYVAQNKLVDVTDEAQRRSKGKIGS
jgi:hypothetical protein